MLKKLSAFAVLAGLCLSLSAAAENFVVISYPVQYWVVGRVFNSTDDNPAGLADGKTVTLHAKGNSGDVIAAGVVSGNDYIINLYDAFFVPAENNAVYQVSVIREKPEDYGAGPEDVAITGKGWNQAPDLQLEKGAGPVKPPADAVPLKINRVNNDNDIQISWGVTNPKYVNPQIFALISSGNEAGQYANAYDPAKWLPVTSDPIKDEFDDVTENGMSDGIIIHNNQSGKNSTHREVYYKALVKGVDLTQPAAQETYKLTPAVGKLDVTVTEGLNLFSPPFIPAEKTLDYIIGKQLTAGSQPNYADIVKIFFKINENTTGFNQAWLHDNQGIKTWENILPGKPELTLNPGEGFWLDIPPGHGEQTMTFIGDVPVESNPEISVTDGLNLVSSNYPVKVALKDAGLAESGAPQGPGPQYACMLRDFYKITIEKTGFDQAWLKNDGQWLVPGSDPPAPSPMALTPGKGYWLQVPTEKGFNWKYPKPY